MPPNRLQREKVWGKAGIRWIFDIGFDISNSPIIKRYIKEISFNHF